MVIQEVLITHLANKITAGELQSRGFLLQATSPAQPEMLHAAVLGMARDIPTGGWRICHPCLWMQYRNETLKDFTKHCKVLMRWTTLSPIF